MTNWVRAELKAESKAAFHRNYWMCVLAGLIMAVFTISVRTKVNQEEVQKYYAGGGDMDFMSFLHHVYGLPEFITGPILGGIICGGILMTIFVGNIFKMGGKYFYYQNLKEPANIREILKGFDRAYMNNVIVLLVMDVKIILWSCLFVIPGIIKSYEYRMIPYIVADNPGMSAEEAFALSREYMTGNKWETFILDLSFILWNILSSLTAGLLGIFYVNPYYYGTDAALYSYLKDTYHGVERERSQWQETQYEPASNDGPSFPGIAAD